jgi:hypothetical protein
MHQAKHDGRLRRHASQRQWQQQIRYARHLKHRHQDRREEHETGERPHAIAIEDAHRAEERCLHKVAVNRQANDRKRIGDGKEHHRRERAREGPIQAIGPIPIQFRATSRTTRDTVATQRRLALQQVAFMAGDQGRVFHGTVPLPPAGVPTSGATGAPFAPRILAVTRSASPTEPTPIPSYRLTIDEYTVPCICA